MSERDSAGDTEQSFSLEPEQLTEYLKDVMGWTGYQAQAYGCVARNGPIEPSDIVALTDVPQGRIYDVMGQLEGHAVNVQGRQPKRYQAQHPRSLLGDQQERFNEKADVVINQLEQQHEIQRERQKPRHPAWIVPGMDGTKRELLEGLERARESVVLVERDAQWIQENEIRDIGRMVTAGISVKVIGAPRWQKKLKALVKNEGVSAWLYDDVDGSFAIIDDDLALMRANRGNTGVKIEDERAVSVFQTAFEALKQDATEVLPNA